jgi:hypothetical protein
MDSGIFADVHVAVPSPSPILRASIKLFRKLFPVQDYWQAPIWETYGYVEAHHTAMDYGMYDAGLTALEEACRSPDQFGSCVEPERETEGRVAILKKQIADSEAQIAAARAELEKLDPLSVATHPTPPTPPTPPPTRPKQKRKGTSPVKPKRLGLYAEGTHVVPECPVVRRVPVPVEWAVDSYVAVHYAETG